MQPYELMVEEVSAELLECVDGSRVKVRSPSRLGALGSGDSSSQGAGVQLTDRRAAGFGGRGGGCITIEPQLPYKCVIELVELPVDKCRSWAFTFICEKASTNSSPFKLEQADGAGADKVVGVATVVESELLLGHFWYTLKCRLVGTSNCCTEHALVGDMDNWLELRIWWAAEGREVVVWYEATDKRLVANDAADGGGGGGAIGCWTDRMDPLWHSEIGM